MNKTNNQKAMYSDSTMMEHTLYHVISALQGPWMHFAVDLSDGWIR